VFLVESETVQRYEKINQQAPSDRMKVVELIKISKETLKMMSDCGIKIGDWQHVKMYEEYLAMRVRREKFRYMMAYLAEKYKLSESSVKRILKRLSGEVML
jgi:hypothetical protein